MSTVSNARPSPKGAGRRGATKFTPQAIEKIKELVAQGVSRDEIANQLDVPVGSLQVTCSKLGVSLRRKQEHKTEKLSQVAAPEAPLAKYALTMSHQGKVLASDIPIASRAIEERLALEATFRDLGITQLVGQILVAAVKKDMIGEILRDEVPPSDG
jgi:hypothetical protein